MHIRGTMEPMGEPQYLTAETVAARLGVTVRSVARYCEAGVRASRTKVHDSRSLVCIKERKTDRTGERWLVQPTSVERFIGENKVVATGLDTSRRVESSVETGLDSTPKVSSPVQTDSIFSFIRAEAAKWKAKWETEREWRMKEREERLAAQKGMQSVAFQLGRAREEIIQLEQKMRLLSSGERSAESTEEATGFEEVDVEGDLSRQDSTGTETGPDTSRQDEPSVEARPDTPEENKPTQKDRDITKEIEKKAEEKDTEE